MGIFERTGAVFTGGLAGYCAFEALRELYTNKPYGLPPEFDAAFAGALAAGAIYWATRPDKV